MASISTKISPGIIEALEQRKTTAKAVAELYGITEGYLSRILGPKGLNIKRIPPPTITKKVKAKLLTQVRTEYRMTLARRVAEGNTDIKTAATEARCTIRTMYRYLEFVTVLKSTSGPLPGEEDAN